MRIDEWPCDFQILCRIDHANFVVESRPGTQPCRPSQRNDRPDDTRPGAAGL